MFFSKAGATDKLDVYDLDADTWESAVMPGTSTILGAVCVDNHIFVLKEEGKVYIGSSIFRKIMLLKKPE